MPKSSKKSAVKAEVAPAVVAPVKSGKKDEAGNDRWMLGLTMLQFGKKSAVKAEVAPAVVAPVKS
nr:nucleotide-binding, alpha-beta plait [Tanacetum cinerariifolium]